jgi:hypothetical protein
MNDNIEPVKKICGAHKTDGSLCQCEILMANGRCRVHGGASTGRPIVHGFYSKNLRADLREKLETAGELVNPLDTTEELAIDRAILLQFLENCTGTALSAEVTGHIIKMTGEIVRKATLMIKSRNETMLTAAEVIHIKAGMEQLVDKYIDPDKRGAFFADLRKLIPGGSGTDDEAQGQ